MNTDIEDFIQTKNRLGNDDYNNFNPQEWDIESSKTMFVELLKWIEEHNHMINMGNNNRLTKIFKHFVCWFTILPDSDLPKSLTLGSIRNPA